MTSDRNELDVITRGRAVSGSSFGSVVDVTKNRPSDTGFYNDEPSTAGAHVDSASMKKWDPSGIKLLRIKQLCDRVTEKFNRSMASGFGNVIYSFKRNLITQKLTRSDYRLDCSTSKNLRDAGWQRCVLMMRDCYKLESMTLNHNFNCHGFCLCSCLKV